MKFSNLFSNPFLANFESSSSGEPLSLLAIEGKIGLDFLGCNVSTGGPKPLDPTPVKDVPVSHLAGTEGAEAIPNFPAEEMMEVSTEQEMKEPEPIQSSAGTERIIVPDLKVTLAGNAPMPPELPAGELTAYRSSTELEVAAQKELPGSTSGSDESDEEM